MRVTPGKRLAAVQCLYSASLNRQSLRVVVHVIASVWTAVNAKTTGGSRYVGPKFFLCEALLF